MSSSVSGKFQDHYIALGVDPKSDSETIQAAYAKLAQKYQSGNSDTADANKFEAINLAYEVLSDPLLRVEFDKIKGVDHDAGNPTFSGAGFFDTLEHSALLRLTVLCLLYERRRAKPVKPSLSRRHVENMLHVTADDLNFALWYLKKRGLVINDDKSSMEISVEGMDYLEQNKPTALAVMPLIREEVILNRNQQSATPAEIAPVRPAEAKVAEPAAVPATADASASAAPEPKPASTVLNALNRALQRSNASEALQPAGRK